MVKQQLTPDQEFDQLVVIVAKLAFSQQKKVTELLREVHYMYHDPAFARYRPYLKLFRGWLVIPYSFWMRDMIGAGRYLVARIRAGEVLSARFILFMRFMREFPPEIAQKIVAMHEHDVQKGKYDSWTRSSKRFDAYEKQILNDPHLREEWEKIKSQFNVDLYRNPVGILRRYVYSERNFKGDDWYFTFDDDESAFYEIFTNFCERFDLWGMEGETPLLLKLTVNILPVGFMIVIPTYMSLDGGRDIRWKKITEVMSALGAARMGARRLAAKEDREDEALRIKAANKQALADGKKGKDRIEYIIRVVGLPANTEDRTIRLRLNLADEILAERQEEEGFDHPSFHTPYHLDKYPAQPATAKTKSTSPAITHPANTSTLAYVKAAAAELSAEEKAELRKWLGN
ncbi:MAG: hypothetical protein H0X66_12250 [Verrucomicrobia bacterium]|nr:hypothetical protein [Verrucomicrobiota bacterium]